MKCEQHNTQMIGDVISRRKVIRVYLPKSEFTGICWLLISDPAYTHFHTKSLKKWRSPTWQLESNALQTRSPLVRSLVDVVGSQYRWTEKTERDKHGLCKLVGSSSRKLCPVRWSVLFVCSTSTLATDSFFSPIQKRNSTSPLSFLLPLSSWTYTHTHTLTHISTLPRLHPESELLSTFSVGWAALPPWGKRTRGGYRISSPSCPWWSN